MGTPVPMRNVNAFVYADWVSDLFERRWRWFLVLFSVIYWVSMVVHAKDGRYLWYDEFFTLTVANLESWPAVLAALKEGADFHPPLTYLFGHTGIRVLGDDHLGLRVAGLAGFWLMSVSIFLFVRRRAGALLGAVAMLVPFVCYTRDLAAQARGYPLLLGFTACALLSWQVAVNRRRSVFPLAVMAASLFLAVGSHWYGVLSFVPIAMGEAVRTWKLKRCDWLVWVALFAGALALVAFLPQMLSASEHAPQFWAKPSFGALLQIYKDLFELAVSPVLVSFGIIVIALLLAPDVQLRSQSLRPLPIPVWEWVAVVSLCVLPLPGYLLALATNVYGARYFTIVVIGVAMCITMFTSQWTRYASLIGVSLFCTLFGCFLLYQRFFFLTGYSDARIITPAGLHADLEAFSDEPVPIVISDRLDFLPLTYYWPDRYKQRTYFVWDDRAARPHHLAQLAPWADLNVASYSRFVTEHKSFYIYGHGGEFGGWLFERLTTDGADIRLVGLEDGKLLSRGTLGAAAATVVSGSVR